MAEKKMTPEEMEQEIRRLQKELGVETTKRNEAEQIAVALTQASQFGGESEEQPTGKTVKQNVCLNPWERKEDKQKFKEIDVPTYFYTIELPAAAGLSLVTNGVDYFHGKTYEVTPDMLADLKSRVARCWDHEKSIHSDNENAYRKPTHAHVMSKAAAQRLNHS